MKWNKYNVWIAKFEGSSNLDVKVMTKEQLVEALVQDERNLIVKVEELAWSGVWKKQRQDRRTAIVRLTEQINGQLKYLWNVDDDNE